MVSFWRRRAPRPAATGFAAWRRAGVPAVSALAIIAPIGMRPCVLIPPPIPAAQTAARGAFSQIVLPDLVVITPRGLPAASLARLAGLRGVRGTLAVDGASVMVKGHPVNVIGVDPARFRAWTPLRTASDQRLWTALSGGEFIASPAARRLLGLRPGQRYHLGRGAGAGLAFGGSGPLGIVGVDLVVPDSASGPLGLIPNVATLVSAPSTAMPALEREVRAALAGRATLISVRGRQLPVDRAATSRRPTTYLQLFRRSAALYCPGLSWTVLAAIGQIESGDGANNGPSTAGALGPMQFMPSTWAKWGITAFGEPGPPDIMDPYDAVPSAALYLCAAGGGSRTGLYRAIFAYNHADWYVREVLALARQYASTYG